VSAGGVRGQTRRRHPAPVSPSLGALGERVKAARQEAGLSQAQLGTPHFTRAYVSAVELGKIRPAVKSLEFLASRLGKPLSFFLEDQAEERRRREREFEMLRAKELIARGAASEAASSLRTLLDAAENTTERVELQRLLARAYTEAKEPAKSLPLLQAAMKTVEARGDLETVALIHRQLAQAYFELREAGEAERHVAAALDGARSGVVRDPLFLVQCLQVRGAVELSLGRRKDAIRSLEEALELGKDIGDRKWLASVYSALAAARWMGGEIDAAIPWMAKSVALYEELDNVAMAADLRFSLGMALLELGRIERATELLQRACDDARRFQRLATVSGCLIQLAKVAIRRGEVSEARRLGTEALKAAEESQDPWVRSETLFQFGGVLERDDPGGADEAYQEAIRLAESTRLGNLQHLYAGYARVLEGRGNEGEAGIWARRALRVTEDASRGG
jgi:tetratricopeptide (TPR) repeat protein